MGKNGKFDEIKRTGKYLFLVKRKLEQLVNRKEVKKNYGYLYLLGTCRIESLHVSSMNINSRINIVINYIRNF